jgi:hypothetical protein
LDLAHERFRPSSLIPVGAGEEVKVSGVDSRTLLASFIFGCSAIEGVVAETFVGGKKVFARS